MKTVKHQSNTYFIVAKRGEEILQSLTDWCRENGICAGYISAIGACGEVALSWYNLKTKSYEDRTVREDMEIANLTGNIALVDGSPFIHAHGTFARRDLSTVAGHVKKLTVSATCEIRLESFEGEMKRVYDEETGLKLIR